MRLTREIPVDFQTTSSLQSSPPPAAPAEDGPQIIQRASSPAFSTSSTADEGGSPILPPLPQPTFNGHSVDILKTPPSSSGGPGSSHYYTASWGSPYQQPTATSNRATSYAHSHTLSSETSEDSPIRHLEFHTPFLRPAPTFSRSPLDPEFVSHDGLISAAVLANRARRPPTGLTEDWIRQHTGGESAERNHWLSDDQGESETSSLSGSISGEGSNSNWLEEESRTPTLKRFLGSRQSRHLVSRGHRRQLTTDTLRQSDFDDSEIPRLTLENHDAIAEMEMEMKTPASERPPTPPPKEWRAAALPGSVEPEALLPVPTPAPVLPRLKKKVPWKGKNILVLLPWDDERGQRGKAPTPMTEKEVNVMLNEWVQLGYDTSGFNLGPGSDDESEKALGQSRTSWPLTRDMKSEREQRAFRVNIPDKREWDAYVEELREAKLRALGVVLGGEDPPVPTISPAVSNLSRRTSMQYPPLPFSPPIPTSSAASSQIAHHQNPFSPALIAGPGGLSTSQSSNPGSIASPASMHGKYNPRQSISFSGGEHPFGSPFQYPQQQSPGVWSPSQMLYQQNGVARGGSPSLQNLGSIVSPASPFSQDGYFPQGGDVMSQMQQRQQHLQTQLAHQQQIQLQRASPRLQDVREIENEDDQASKSPSKTPEARQIRHNPSASLQEEIDAAEYHLEEQFKQQLEHQDYSPHSEKDEDHFYQKPVISHIRDASAVPQGLGASRFAIDKSENEPVLHHPQPHSRGHSLSQKPFVESSEDSATESKHLQAGAGVKSDLSDVETNPSNLGTPLPNNPSGNEHARAMSVSSNPWADSEPNHTESTSVPRRGNSGHGPKPSMSKLNVDAKEFKFNPSSTFTPSQFSFNGNTFQPPISAFSPFAPPSATSSHFSHPSIASSRGNLNVTAPTFTPGNSEFNFSSSGPTFRPDVPSFTPQMSASFSDSVGSGSDAQRSSIFGKIDLSAIGITKPSKKSKAIPIVRPDSSHSRDLEDETVEDGSGRITQGEGRIKRARGAKADGDSVPLFADPSLPLGETNRDQSPPKEKETTPMPTTAADKENSAPPDENAEEQTPELPPKSHARTFSGTSPVQNFAPWEFTEKKQAEDFNTARPFTSRRYGSGLPAYGFPGISTDEEPTPVEEPTKLKGHKKAGSSLSAAAKPFEFKPSALNFSIEQPSESAPAPAPVPTSKPTTMGGLSASRFARSPTPPAKVESPEINFQPHETTQFQGALPQPQSPPSYDTNDRADVIDREPTFEEIDAVMRQLNEAEFEPTSPPSPLPAPVPAPAPAFNVEAAEWHQPSPTRRIQVPNPENSSPIRLQPQSLMRSDAPSPSPARFRALPGDPRIFTRVQEDPFIAEDTTVHHLNNIADSAPPSEWDDVLSETEEAKLQPRAQFFDNHVNNLVGGLLAERLDPLERTLESIQMSLDMMAARAPSSRRDRRSVSGALSDADDEDDEIDPRRSMSPRRDKKMERIRAVVAEALNAHQPRPQTTESAVTTSFLPDSRNVLQVLEEMKEQFGQSMRLDLRGEDLRNVVEEAVERRIPLSPKPVVDEAAVAREAEYKIRIANLEEKLFQSDIDQSTRLSELEEKLRKAESNTEEETKNRRAAEDRLSEVQRLLRIASEEETRLREAMDDRESKIREITSESELKVRSVEEQRGKTAMRIALLEATQGNAQKTQSEMQNRINITENDLRESRKDTQRWQMEAERALDAARRHSEDAEQANETNKDLRRTIESLRIQMEESIRVREGMRGKLMDLQEDVARAAREIADENARRAKKEQELIARQEVLDAKLQAEARTRERLETEIERLEAGERGGMRAVSECKKLEALVADLRMENHKVQQDAMRFQREFQEARESGMSEVQRTRHYMQAEVEAANNQVNVVREDLEHQLSKLRAEMDHIKMDADTARAKSEMLIEEAENSKKSHIDDLKNKHADAIEDMQTQHDRQLQNALEDAQRHEQHLLERLSLSSAKTEHLQDRIAHLEEKLEIANAAANAAASAAKTARSASVTSQVGYRSKGMDVPEKISPQALRESIMVLQEQLQERESTIENLELTIADLDPDSATKIQKRDDEIMWLRELLAVRKGDLQDIVQSLESGGYDNARVRDAAIRLRANLQMEEQERERAMNGGSAINLPNIAASLRDVAASPRVAQAVGPLAAAWGNWRKGRGDITSISETLLSSRDRSSSSTPSKHSPGSSLLGGLLTPPASTSQPTAFGSTGQRFTSSQLANRPRVPVRGSPKVQRPIPKTPPMLRKASYDADARPEDFSDAGFFDDDQSPIEADFGGPGPARRY